VLSVLTCSTPFFVNCTSISVNFEKIKVIIFFANKSNILSCLEILLYCALSSTLGEEMEDKEGLGVGVLVRY
jgi:hypothetical protein